MPSDIQLAGYETVGVFTPIQLWAGEKQPVSTQGVLTAGQKVGQLNGRGETFKFPVVALVGGKFVKWDPAGANGAAVIAGVLPHALDASATGTNADIATPVFVEGIPNFEALDIGAVDYATIRAAAQAPGVALVFQKLY